MFRAIILPFFRSTRQCVTAFGIMHQLCYQPATSSVHYTTSSERSLVLLRMVEISVIVALYFICSVDVCMTMHH